MRLRQERSLEGRLNWGRQDRRKADALNVRYGGKRTFEMLTQRTSPLCITAKVQIFLGLIPWLVFP